MPATQPLKILKGSSLEECLDDYHSKLYLVTSTLFLQLMDKALETFMTTLTSKNIDSSSLGKTKFDRVITRALNTKGKSQLVTELSNQLQMSRKQKCLILGSAYLEDLEVTLQSLRKNSLRERIKLIIAPHNIDQQTISQIVDRVTSEGYLPRLASQVNLAPSLKPDLPAQSRYHHDTVVFIIDSIGYLAEIYSLGDAAWVGGGLTNKVHNVLEPACHGLRTGKRS